MSISDEQARLINEKYAEAMAQRYCRTDLEKTRQIGYGRLKGMLEILDILGITVKHGVGIE